jgi:3-hydroxyisobutyrate dehydrogenase-like beta-hydroxyacid dehydrogenase
MAGAKQVGLLHPGQMGASIGAAAQRGGNTVWWASHGRGAATRTRAEQAGLRDAGSLAQLCAACDVIVSVCPPHAAEDVARQVAETGFGGLYVDANAIEPQRARQIGAIVGAAGAACVDGGIVGGPAWKPGTWLYLSGERAAEAAELFETSPLATSVLGNEIGTASALKMCYAAYTKGTTALLCAIMATSERLGVREALAEQWNRDNPGFADDVTGRVRGVTAKAWRFAGEMDEIAATFESAGLPGGFHRAAADVYRRLAPFKDAPETPALADVLAALLEAR